VQRKRSAAGLGAGARAFGGSVFGADRHLAGVFIAATVTWWLNWVRRWTIAAWPIAILLPLEILPPV